MAWLRDNAVFDSFHSLLASGASLGMVSAAVLGLRLERSPSDRIRALHGIIGATGLLLALTAAVAGFAILP